MSTGTPAPKSFWKMKFEKFAVWFTCIFFGFLILNGLFGGRGGSQPEPFNPHKMSQVPRVWPAPAWAVSREGELPVQYNPLRNFELKLQQGLESIPQDTADREYRSVPWYGSVPVRREPPPFQFYGQWAAQNCQ